MVSLAEHADVDTTSSVNAAWFPRHISEVRECCTTLYKFGEDLTEDHPSYGDNDYVEIRREIAKIAMNYK